MTQDPRQTAYAAKRAALRGEEEKRFPTVEYRIYRPGMAPFVERAIGVSVIAAHYPDLVRVEVVGFEPGGFW